MDITSKFSPVAKRLIDQIFPTAITYHRTGGQSYDPAIGEVTNTIEDYSISAGVLKRARQDDGGAGENYQLDVWIQHTSSGMPHLPTTSDEVTYAGQRWRVSTIDPTYSSEGLIASKLICHG